MSIGFVSTLKSSPESVQFKDCQFEEIQKFGKFKHMFKNSKYETSYRTLKDQWENVYHLVVTPSNYFFLHPSVEEGCWANAFSSLPENDKLQDYIWNLPPPYKAYKEVEEFNKVNT